MKLSYKIITLVIILSFFVITSCNELVENGIDEGILKYKITYLEDKADNPLISLLPSHLEMHFKDNSVSLCVKGWMGIFESVFIKQAETGNSITTLKIMNKKLYYISDSVVGFMGDSKYLDLQLKFDNQKKRILNFDCKHALVFVPSENLKFDIFYTDEISIDNPNGNTIFEDIPGVLMEFQVEMNGIPMHLIATELVESKVPDDDFCIPIGYKEVEKREVDTIFSSIM